MNQIDINQKMQGKHWVLAIFIIFSFIIFRLYLYRKAYFVLQKTDTKTSEFLTKYSYLKKYNHIGILFIEKSTFTYFEITYNKESNVVQKCNFFNFAYKLYKNSDFKIYDIENFYKVDIFKMKNVCDSFYYSKIKYDTSFQLHDNRFYCSEMVASAIKNSSSTSINTDKVKLNGIIKSYLNRDSLEFIPVDFFVNQNN